MSIIQCVIRNNSNNSVEKERSVSALWIALWLILTRVQVFILEWSNISSICRKGPLCDTRTVRQAHSILAIRDMATRPRDEHHSSPLPPLHWLYNLHISTATMPTSSVRRRWTWLTQSTHGRRDASRVPRADSTWGREGEVDSALWRQRQLLKALEWLILSYDSYEYLRDVCGQLDGSLAGNLSIWTFDVYSKS